MTISEACGPTDVPQDVILMWAAGSSTGGGVAWLAHIGGFIFGWLVVKLYVKIRGQGITPSGGQRVYTVRWR